MTYEQTYYFYNSETERAKETITINIHENSISVYNLKYDEIDHRKKDEDTFRTFDKDRSLNAEIVFQNLVDLAKAKFKFYRVQTSQTFDICEIK